MMVKVFKCLTFHFYCFLGVMETQDCWTWVAVLVQLLGGHVAGTSLRLACDDTGSEDEGTSEHGRDALAAAVAEQAALEAAAVKRKKGKKGNAGLQSEAAAAADQPAGITSGHPGEGAKKKKKRKQPSADDDGAEQASPAGVIAAEGKDSNGQKKKEKVKQQDARGPEQAQKSGGLSGPPDAGGDLSRPTALEALLTGTEAQGLGKRHKEKGACFLLGCASESHWCNLVARQAMLILKNVEAQNLVRCG